MILTLGPDVALTRQVERLARQAGARCATGHAGSTMDALRIMVALGDAVAVMPESSIRSAVRGSAEVAVRRLAGQSVPRVLVLASRQSRGEPSFVEPLAGALRGAAAAAQAEAVPGLAVWGWAPAGGIEPPPAAPGFAGGAPPRRDRGLRPGRGGAMLGALPGRSLPCCPSKTASS